MEEELLISESPTCTSAHLKQNPPLNSRMRSACFFISAARVQWALCHTTSLASIHSAAPRGHCCAPVTLTVKPPWKDLVGYPGDSADKVITNQAKTRFVIRRIGWNSLVTRSLLVTSNPAQITWSKHALFALYLCFTSSLTALRSAGTSSAVQHILNRLLN